MQPVITYGLLGSLEVRRDGALLDIGGGKQLAVLALLLLDAGRAVSVDRIVDALWGDEPPPSAGPSVHAYISKLRRALRADATTPPPLGRRGAGYAIDVTAGALDLDRFGAGCEETRGLVEAGRWTEAAERAAQTSALWRGPLLTELADEEWVRVAARPWEERRLHLEHDRVKALLGCDRELEAVSAAARLAEAYPLDERAYALHVIALHRAGRTAEALQVWQAFASFLDEELGLDPGPELRDLQGSVLRQDRALDVWPRRWEDEPPRRPTASAGPLVRSGGFVGRSRELAALARVVDAVRSGRSACVLISGPPGIGKSRLAEEGLALMEERGGAVVRVRCPEDPDLPAWWPLRRLLADLGHDPVTVLETMTGPELEPARFVVTERLGEVLREAGARGSLLVLLDDVQWADASTLDVLTQLAGTDRLPGVGLVLTCREESLGPGVVRLVTAVARRPDVLRLVPDPLAEAEVAKLAADVGHYELTADDVVALARTTGGNPLFVSEYARLPAHERAAGTVPLVVRSVLQRRLGVLDPDALDVLRAAAVLGEPVDLTVLAAVRGLEVVELGRALGPSIEQRLLFPARGGYTFGHALIRQELLDDTPLLRRQELSARAAAALTGRTGSEQLGRRAAYLLAAGPFADPDVVVGACAAAAADAERRWSGEDAVRWWERALTAARAHEVEAQSDGATGVVTVDREDLVVGLASALVRTGQGQRTLDLVDDSLVDAWREGRTGSVGVVASLLLRLTGCWPWPAYGTDPGPLTARLAALEPRLVSDVGAQARVLGALAIASCYDPDPDVPEGLSARSVELATSTGDPDVLADALLGRAMTFSGVARRAAEGLQLVARLDGLPHRLARFDEVVGHGLASMATAALGDLAAMHHHVQRGTELSESLHLPVSLAQFRWAQSALALWRADDVDAVDAGQARAFVLHEQTELVQPVTLILARLTLRWEQGLLADGLGLSVSNPFLTPWIDAVVSAARAEPGAADQLAREVARPEPEVWTSHGRLTLLAHAVADLRLTALVPEIRRRLEPYAPFLANFGQTGIVGPVSLALGRLALLDGHLLSARRYAEQAAGMCERTGGANSLLRTRLLRAEIEIAAGQAPEMAALDHLRRRAQARGLRGVSRTAELVSIQVTDARPPAPGTSGVGEELGVEPEVSLQGGG